MAETPWVNPQGGYYFIDDRGRMVTTSTEPNPNNVHIGERYYNRQGPIGNPRAEDPPTFGPGKPFPKGVRPKFGPGKPWRPMPGDKHMTPYDWKNDPKSLLMPLDASRGPLYFG